MLNVEVNTVDFYFNIRHSSVQYSLFGYYGFHAFFLQLPDGFNWRAGIGNNIINLVKPADAANSAATKLGTIGHHHYLLRNLDHFFIKAGFCQVGDA